MALAHVGAMSAHMVLILGLIYNQTIAKLLGDLKHAIEIVAFGEQHLEVLCCSLFGSILTFLNPLNKVVYPI